MATVTRAAEGAEPGEPGEKKEEGATNVDGSTREAKMCELPYSKQVVLVVGGKGRVGKALDKMAASLGYFHGCIARDDAFTPSAQRDGPIYVATHASDLDAAVKAVHSNRKQDLVLMQGGLLRASWLKRRGLDEATQVVLFASANANGEITDGGGSTVVTGPYAKHVVGMLEAGGVACTALEPEPFKVIAMIKLLWVSIFWLVCDLTGSTVGEVVDDEAGMARVRSLTYELVDVAVSAGEIDANLAGVEGWVDGVVEGLCYYSRCIPHAVPSKSMALKEGGFRNGWFLAAGTLDVQPMHVELLGLAGVNVEDMRAAGLKELEEVEESVAEEEGPEVGPR